MSAVPSSDPQTGRPGVSLQGKHPAGPGRGSKRRRIRTPLTSRRNAFLLLAPTLILIAIYAYGPIFTAIWASGQNYSPSGVAMGNIGLDNFTQALTDSSFLHSLGLTVLLAAIKIPTQLALGFGAAMLLFRSNRFNSFLRVALILPAVTPIAIIGIIFLFLFDREVGVTNALLSTLGVGRVGWLTTPAAAQFVVLFASVWRDAGFTMLIFLTGLTAIPAEVLEASTVDGANSRQTTVHIVAPMLQRSWQLATVLTTISAFQYFAPIFVLTQGGPQNATDVAAFHVYEEAFVNFNQGEANAMALILVAMIMVVTAVELYLLRTRWEY